MPRVPGLLRAGPHNSLARTLTQTNSGSVLGDPGRYEHLSAALLGQRMLQHLEEADDIFLATVEVRRHP